MIRKIIHINEEKCNGCGLCAAACHEGAIRMVDGKARLIRDDYCDGLGDCLPACPTGAITFEAREAAAYDEQAVAAHKEKMAGSAAPASAITPSDGCPGKASRTLSPANSAAVPASAPQTPASELAQWPVQIKLVPVHAPYYDGADLLVAADFTAYAYGNFHERFIKNRITLIGCPKLDSVDYTEKLTAIIRENDIRSVTVIRMEVPCCGGLEYAVKEALKASGKFIPWHVVTISTDGRILSE